MSPQSRSRNCSKLGKWKYQNKRRFKKRPNLADNYSSLEARHLLAFTMGFDAGTLTLTQTVAEGHVVIDNNGTDDAFRVTDGSGTTEFLDATNLVVNLLDDTLNNLSMRFDNAHAGNVELNLGDGERDVFLFGSLYTIDGDLNISGAEGNQSVYLDQSSSLTLVGNLFVDLGLGSDEVSFESSLINTITGDVDLIGADRSHFFYVNVGGSISSDVSGESEDSSFVFGTSSSVAGELNVTGGDGLDLFSSYSSATFGADVNIDLGDGVNEVYINGIINGETPSIRYVGGVDADAVSVGTTGNPANVNILLGAGDDTFTLNSGAISETTLRVDFGGGVDSFFNNWGTFDFNASFLNWDGFNRFYNNALDQWHLFQLESAGTGDVTINENGNVGLTNTYMTPMSRASTVRLTMLDNTGNVNVDLYSGLAGDLILDLQNGDRNVNFGVESMPPPKGEAFLSTINGGGNSIGGHLFVRAGDGDQNVDIASNSQFHVDGSAVMNLRNGFDAVSVSSSHVYVGESLIFRGVNDFENMGYMSLGNMLMNSTFEVAQARLDNDNRIDIVGALTYIGGTSKDDVLLTGVHVGGNVSLDLGANEGVLFGQTVSLGRGFSADGDVFVFGGDSNGGNALITGDRYEEATRINGSLFVDFSMNTFNSVVVLEGNLGNFGAFWGGSGNDVVQLDTDAEDMDLFLNLGAGDDTLFVDFPTLNSLFANFGDGTDTLNDFNDSHPFLTEFWNVELIEGSDGMVT